MLLFVMATGVSLRREKIREWWIERSSTAALRESAQTQGADVLTLFVYGKRSFRAGDWDAAIGAFDAAFANLIPSDKSDLAQRVCSYDGYLHARRGEKDKAVPPLTRARDLNSDDPTPHLGFGILLAEEKLPGFAATQFQLVTQLDPENVEGWYRLGRAYTEDLKAHQAVDPLKHAVVLAPKDAASHSELGVAYAIQSQFPMAVPELRRAAELDPGNVYYQASLANALAMSARTQQEYHDASILLGNAIKNVPDSSSLEFTLGLLHLRFNNIEVARERFKRSVAVRPADAEAWYNLSVAELRLGNKAASEEARKRYQRLSDIRTEMSNLEKSVSSTPSDALLRLRLAKAYERAGNPLGAYWQANTSARLSPNDKGAASYREQVKRKYPMVAAPGNGNPLALRGQAPGPPPPPQLTSIPLTGGAANGLQGP